MMVTIDGITCSDYNPGKLGTLATFCQFSTLFLCLIYRFLKPQSLEYEDGQALRGSGGQENLCEKESLVGTVGKLDSSIECQRKEGISRHLTGRNKPSKTWNLAGRKEVTLESES